jgi:adhesin/invasin
VRVWKASFVVPVAVLLLCTCESFPTLPVLADSVTTDVALPQSSTVGSQLVPSIIVKDASGNALPRFQVTFAVTSGGGSVNPVATLTDDNGKASAQWTLGTTAGEQQVIATAGSKTVSFTVTGTADVASQIAASPGTTGQTAPPGAVVPNPPSVIVRDAHGNPKAGVAVTFAVASGGGSVTGSATTTNASGVATVGSWRLGSIAQTNTLTATSPGLAGSPVTFTATAVAVGGTLSVNAGNNQFATVNTAVAVAPSVAIRDANNNPVVGASVTFAVASGGGSVTGATVQTNGSGIATVGSWTLGTTAGINTLTATSASGSATFTATGTAAAASTVAINTGNAQTSTAGSPVAIPPSVIVKDQFGNPVSGASVTFAVVSGGGSVTGSPATTNAAGIATVGSWILGPTAGANSLTATSGNLTPVTFTATGTAGAGSVAVNGGNNQTATVNTTVAVDPSVIIKDVNGNPIAGSSVTFAVASGGGSVTGATTATNAGGIATVGAWKLGTSAGTNTLTATSSAGSTTFTATGVAGAATQIAIDAGNNQTAAAGTAVAIAPSVIVRDAFNNPKGGVAVTFAVASGGGSITGGAATTNTSGVATVGSWTLGTTVGTNTLTATSGTLTGSPVTFTANGVTGAATIAVNAGNNQTATVNTAVAVAPSVIIKDSNNNPISGASVTFAIASGGGSITGATTTTDASGIATVGSWTLGNTAGTNTLTASSASAIGSPVTFSATGFAGAPATAVINAGNNQTADAGTPVAIPPSVLVKDAFGNPVSNLAVTFAVASGGGSVSGGSGTTNASGIATVGGWTLGTTIGANTLTATAGSLAPVTFTATGVTGPGIMTLTAGGNQTATVNTAVSIAPSVTIKDAHNNPVVGATVTFAVASGGGSITGGTTTTNTSGVATLGSWTLGTTAGTNTLTASSSGVSGSPLTITATGTADVAQTMTLNAGSNQTANAGTTVPTPPSVLVKDQFNNPVSGVAVSFTVASGGGSTTGSAATTNASGIAAVGSWKLGNAPGTNTLTASSAAVAGVTITFTATGTVGPAATIALFLGDGQTAPAGTAVPTQPSVTVRDAVGNPVSGVTVTFAVTSGGGSAAGLSPSTDGSGVATVGNWILGPTAGQNTLTASSPGLSGSPVLFTATGTTPATSITTNNGDGQSAIAGSQVATPPSVIVKDASGNPVAGVTVTFAVTSGGGSATGVNTVSDASGIATVGSWTLGTTAGANTLTATSAGLTGSPVTFMATGVAGPPASLFVNAGDNQTAPPGATVTTPPSLIVRDVHGNAVSGVTVTFTVASGGGSATGTSTTTDANGIATVGSWTLGPATGTNTLTATVTTASASFSLTFTATAQ